MTAPDPSAVRFDGPWLHRDIHANGIRLHAVEVHGAGPLAPLVLLLHGFGQFWWSWRHQLTALTELGYRAVAVDLRGYGDSDKPPRGYDGWTLAGDTAGLIRALGHDDAMLVGHADGGLVCWAAAQLQQRHVSKIALIGSPHPSALRHSVLRDKAQRAAITPSLAAYQVPMRPERALTRHDARAIDILMRERSGDNWRGTEDFEAALTRYRNAIRIPGAVHCALEYQRWAVRSQFRAEGRRFTVAMAPPITIPVLHLRGAQDRYVLEDPVRRTRAFAPQASFVTLPGAGHYAHEEDPAAVNELLARFLA